jgi:large repetitive protein
LKSLLFAAALVAANSAVASGSQDLDAFALTAASRPVPGPLSAGVGRLVARGRIAHVEERLGVPTFFWAARERAAPGPRSVGLNAVQSARRHLFDYAELYRTHSATLAEAPLDNLHDTGGGAVIATFSKQVAGVPVFRDAIHVVMDREYRLVAITGYLSPHNQTRHRWKLTRASALSVAFSDLTGRATAPSQFAETNEVVGEYHHLEQLLPAGAAFLTRPSRVRDVLFSLPEELVPAYYVEVDVSDGRSTDSRVFSYVVSAVDGALLFRHNLTASDGFTYRVWAEPSGRYVPFDGPQGTVGTPHPTGLPDGFQARLPHEAMGVPPNLVTLQNSPFSRNDPWLLPFAAASEGNNVDAYADRTAPDGYDPASQDTRARTTLPNTFDYAYDTALNPDANAVQIQASVTNLFFVNNFLHDWYYDSGFDEASRNAQNDNFGRGGLGGDRIRAEAQDFDGSNNASMSTPADGRQPRMQVHIFNVPAVCEAQGCRAPVSKLTVNSPATIAGDYPVGLASVGPQAFDLTADILYAPDGDGSFFGCAPYLPNTFAQKIALVDAGVCDPLIKIEEAEAAGAVGFVLANNSVPVTSPSRAARPINIPAFAINPGDALAIKNQLAAGSAVNVRMFREATIDRDGALDNGIVAHEWFHYVSNRLIGNSAGLNNNQGLSLGEGWSDFNALMMIVREEDARIASNPNFTGVYALSAYVTLRYTLNNYYFGVRRVPYSTNMEKNALTFRHIEDGVPLPTTHPILVQKNNAEVHNAGEIWCTMLWEVYVSLLQDTERYTFAQAQEVMKSYLIASLKVTPNSPTFLEARDALLAVALANEEDDFELFAEAFAKRGAGIMSVAPPRFSTTHQPTIESFLTGDDVAFAAAEFDDDAVYCDRDGILDNGEIGTFTFWLKNTGFGDLGSLRASVSSPTPGVRVIGGRSLSLPRIGPLELVRATVQIQLTGARSVMPIQLKIEFDDPSLAVPGPRSQTLVFRGNWDDVPNASATETADAPSSPWVKAHDSTLAQEDWTRRQESPNEANFLWAGPDAHSRADVYLVSPPLDVGLAPFSFTFRHRHSFEFSGNTFWDGGVIEISTDRGQTWTDIGAAANPGYSGTLAITSGNPLGGRNAYGGKNRSHPAFETVTVKLGTTYQSHTVQLRFRIAADAAVGDDGWEIDDIAFTGITNTPFSAQVVDPGSCINRAPIALTIDQIVDALTLVILDSSESFDPDGDPMTIAWTQLSGPAVTISNATFIAPRVSEDTELRFRLTISDGQLVSNEAISTIVVRGANYGPTANAGESVELDAGGTCRLDGSASFDVDDDAITCRWTQESGPPVTLRDATSATPTFDTFDVLPPVANVRQDLRVPPNSTGTLDGSASNAGSSGCSAGGSGAMGAGALMLLGLALLGRRRIVHRGDPSIRPAR